MEKIRISCACFARIEIDGKYLLLQNKRMRNKNIIQYTPVGGALEWYDDGLSFLKSINCSFEKGRDLRLMIFKDRYESFKEWFYLKKGREISIFREMREELVDEDNILESLVESDFKESFVGCFETIREWSETNDYGGTFCFFEIYDVKFSESIQQKIMDKLLVDDKIKLFSYNEIKEDVICKYILPNF